MAGSNEYEPPTLTRLARLLEKLARDVSLVPTFRYAVVTSVSPLRVRYDLDGEALAGTPETLVSGLAVGDRVWVQRQFRRDIVLGRSKGSGHPSDGVYAVTPGTGWAVHGAHDSYLEVRNGWAELRATLRVATGGSFNTILNVPPRARLQKPIFVGTFNTSADSSASGALHLTPDGVLSCPSGYRQGTLAAGGYLPLVASWRVY